MSICNFDLNAQNMPIPLEVRLTFFWIYYACKTDGFHINTTRQKQRRFKDW